MNYASPYKGMPFSINMSLIEFLDNMIKKIYETNSRNKLKPKVLLPQLKVTIIPNIRKPTSRPDFKASRSPQKQCKCELYQEKICTLQKEKNSLREILKKTLQVKKINIFSVF